MPRQALYFTLRQREPQPQPQQASEPGQARYAQAFVLLRELQALTPDLTNNPVPNELLQLAHDVTAISNELCHAAGAAGAGVRRAAL